MRKKRSFFEKLTGTINTAHDDDIVLGADDAFAVDVEEELVDEHQPAVPEVAELMVDVYQTLEDIYVKTIVAGVGPEELEVEITREMITISGERHHDDTTPSEDYFHQELYWGPFSRTVMLPEEIDVEAAEASQKHGLLTIRLPKIDKKRKTKLDVRAE